jgi:hypothetical protein
MPAMWFRILGAWLLSALSLPVFAQTPEVREDEAVGESINYVFATDLGSGVYELDGRTLQIYRFNWQRELRETRDDRFGIRAVVPVTAGFFDFNPFDVISSGPPTRVDSFSVVPGLELEIVLDDGWRLIPYARTGFSVASSSVDGWLYGAGVRLERDRELRGWERFERSELAYSGVKYRHETPGDQFLRLRQGYDFTRTFGRPFRQHHFELGLYAVFDVIFDPPTMPLAGGERMPIQAEFGLTFASRPRLKIWRFDAPRVGFGYRVAGELSAWRLVIGAPF